MELFQKGNQCYSSVCVFPYYILCGGQSLFFRSSRMHGFHLAWFSWRTAVPQYTTCRGVLTLSNCRVQTLLRAPQPTDHYVHNRCFSWSVTNHIPSFRVCQWWSLTAHLLLGSHTERKVCHCVAPLSPRDKLMWHFTDMDNQKRELTNKDEIFTKN